MNPLRLAVVTRRLGRPISRVLSTAARSGASGLWIDARDELPPRQLSATGRRQFLHQLGELGLGVAGLDVLVERPLYDERDLEVRVDLVRRALRFAFDLRAPRVAVRMGRVPEEDSAEHGLLRELLSDLAREGDHVGATLVLVPGGDDPAILRALLDSIDTGPLGIELDPAGCVFADNDPALCIRTWHERLLHVRLRDGVRDLDGSGLEVPVGRGDVDWTELLATLAEVGYAGWLTADRSSGDDRAGDVVRALAYVRNVLPG